MPEKEKTEEELAQEAAAADFEAAMAAMPVVAGPGFPAARIGDRHICPIVDGVKPHVGGPIAKDQPNVLIGGVPVARVTDMVTCVVPPDTIVKGSATVLIGGMSAARMLDLTAHGDTIVMGFPQALIGG
jgi:uncharacterized Zn-binding protein involved in type VI secretion